MAPFLRSQAAAYFLLPLSAACWAGNHVVARAAGGHVPPASLAVARWLLIVLIVLPFALPHLAADRPKLKRNAGILLLLAAVGGGAFGTLQFVALHFTTALNMGVVGSVAPAFIVAASWLLFRDRLSWTATAGRHDLTVGRAGHRQPARRWHAWQASASTAAISSSSPT